MTSRTITKREFRRGASLLVALGVVVALVVILFRALGALAAPAVTTNKPDYFSGETVAITGSDFSYNTTYAVPVIRPDKTIVKSGGGCASPCWDTVTTNGSGAFTYSYQLNGIQGTYEVRVYPSSWTGNLAETPLASTTFTDGDIHFTQCRNDSDNNEAIDNCEWSTGAINQTNSFYTEGNSVPQRLFHQIDSAGAHTMRLQYEFTRASIYAYDFLTNVDGTMAVGTSGLNECADLPPFVSSATCATLFSGAALSSIPSDPFDAVSTRENPVSRNFRVGCSPACSGAIIVSFPDLNGEPPGEAHVPDSDPDCFQNCPSSDVQIDLAFTTAAPNTTVAVWFGGDLAQAAGPNGWGTSGCAGSPCGASSVSGAPFHLKYISLDDKSVGNRDNQIQIGAVVVLTPTPTSTATPTVTSTPTAMATDTPTATATGTATATATDTPTATATGTPTATVTSTPTAMATDTPTATATGTATATATNTPTATATGTATATATGTPMATATSTATAMATNTPTATSTPTGVPHRPVGGIVRIWPDDPDPRAVGASDSSSRKHTTLAALAAAMAAGAIVLGTGAWYARRRWLR